MIAPPSSPSSNSERTGRRQLPAPRPISLRLGLTIAVVAWVPTALAALLPCGPLDVGVGNPYYDYTDKSPKNAWHLRDVYQNHYVYDTLSQLKSPKPNMRRMIGGIMALVGRIPNDYRGLEMYSRLYKRFPAVRSIIKHSTDINRYRPMTPRCVFDRAFRVHPKDATPRLLYGLFFHRMGNLQRALEQYKIAAKIRPNWAEAHYNIGLIYLHQKDYTAARKHARLAYKLGYPLPALRNKLKKVGAWP